MPFSAIANLVGGILGRSQEKRQFNTVQDNRREERDWAVADRNEARVDYKNDVRQYHLRDRKTFKDDRENDREYLQGQKIGDRNNFLADRKNQRFYDRKQADRQRGMDRKETRDRRAYNEGEADRQRELDAQQYDERVANQFTAQRDAAVAAGFNPLSVLGAAAPSSPSGYGAYDSGSSGSYGGSYGGGGGGGGGGGVGSGTVTGGGAQSFQAASNFGQSGYAPISSIGMITQGIADAADYFNPESENRREQERLQTDLMKIELEKQRSGVNTGDSMKNPVSPMRDVKVSSTMTPENTPGATTEPPAMREMNMMLRVYNPVTKQWFYIPDPELMEMSTNEALTSAAALAAAETGQTMYAGLQSVAPPNASSTTSTANRTAYSFPKRPGVQTRTAGQAFKKAYTAGKFYIPSLTNTSNYDFPISP